MLNIIVNGSAKLVAVKALSYDDVVLLGYGEKARKAVHSITYRSKSVTGSDVSRSGTLAPGQSVVPEEGMIFNAYVTDNA